ncbi:hypothetical protein T4E_7638 [Trichinella pseudospiralis]|uniref:Uncharacterized protein n=1 Tax=Trichinella pseudospiralis TaxID=6337 RepID=A0A0V0XIL6_TRIPS|nr:hypothetical protein T4E_7638 [Trichinella pseudospiralis]
MSKNHGRIEWLDLRLIDYYRRKCKAIYNIIKEQWSEDGEEFLVQPAVMHGLFSYMEMSQLARGGSPIIYNESSRGAPR